MKPERERNRKRRKDRERERERESKINARKKFVQVRKISKEEEEEAPSKPPIRIQLFKNNRNTFNSQ